MNVLYGTPYVPSPIRTRPYNLIRALLRLGHKITLLTAAGTSNQEHEWASELRDWGAGVEVFAVSLARSLFNCLRALPTRKPLQAAYAYHPVMERRLRELIRRESFDVVHIEHLRAARHVGAVTEIPVVYDSVDCISLLFEQAARSSPEWRYRLMTALDLRRTRSYEAWLQTQCDQVVVTSARDREALEDLASRYLPADARPAPISVVTNGVDLDYFQPAGPSSQRDDRTVVFTGKMSYHANVAAALYFAKVVLPLIWARDPDVRFQIVGKDPPEPVQKLAGDRRIEVTGYVDDLRPYLSRATVAVCPALYAVGIQNKVLEAMAMGTPVVSTAAGCAALDVTGDEEILIAAEERQLAASVLRLISEPALANRLSMAARQYVEARHSWRSSAHCLTLVYEEARLA
ncbi:MAG: glycosyltransferase [Anaerolineae bacterium]|jgi:sugar transferase (PEP-CTERM/EpsH1 system associated)